MKNLTTIILILFISIIGCKTSKFSKASFKNVSSFNNVPSYYPLNLPMGQLELPAVLVGNEELPSSGCFKTESILKPVSGYDQIIQQAERQRNIEASIKAKLKKEFFEAGLESEFNSFMNSSVTSRIYGSTVYLVDPSKSGPDFDNERCRVEELKWYDDNRVIITGAIKADSIFVDFTDTLSNELKNKFDLVISKLNTDLKATFNRAVQENGKISIKGKDIFYAGLTTSVTSATCGLKFDTKLVVNTPKSFELCKNKIIVKRSEGFERYSVNFINVAQGISSGYHDVKVGELASIPFGENRFANIIITPSDEEFEIETSITLVGLSSN